MTPITVPFPHLQLKDDPTSEVDIPGPVREARRSGTKDLEPYLVILRGFDMGRAIPITAEGLVIGRDESCQLVLGDDAVSKRHLRIALEGSDRVAVSDLDSTNGTFVRGRRIDSATLVDGEKLFLGRGTVLKFVIHDRLELAYQRELYESSVRDGLTGAFNRRYFSEKIGADLSFGRRHGLPLSLLMLDIDHFKQVNDTYGHDAGDEALCAVCRTVAGSIRTEDVLARFGGEEFAIIAQGTGLDGGRALGERIRRNVGAARIRAGARREISLTVSAGVASLRPGAAADAGSLIAAADENLYAAKNAGRDRVMASEVG
jgi:diguanylate cyclase (GGDEF)-like protein